MLQVETNDGISLVIPAYNEREAIGKTLREVIQYFDSNRLPFEILVVADGNDGTREFVGHLAQKDRRISVMGSAERSGKGLGVKNGILKAKMKFVGFLDADNKTPITEFDKIFPYLKKGIPVVIGSRAKKGAQIENPQPWFRRLGSRGFSAYLRMVLGLWDIPDTQCGFKFFETKIAQDIFSEITIAGYMFDVELLYLTHRKKLPIAQVPVRWRDDGDSRLDLFSGNFKNAQDILKIRFRTLFA